MKHLIFILFALVAFNVEAQSLKTLTDKVEKASESGSQSSFVDKFAEDQVKKLTKKLNLSESQQAKVSEFVVSQLKSDKFQKLLSSFSPEQLLSGSAKKEVSEVLKSDPDFKSGIDDILTDDQKEMAKHGDDVMKG